MKKVLPFLIGRIVGTTCAVLFCYWAGSNIVGDWSWLIGIVFGVCTGWTFSQLGVFIAISIAKAIHRSRRVVKVEHLERLTRD